VAEDWSSVPRRVFESLYLMTTQRGGIMEATTWGIGTLIRAIRRASGGVSLGGALLLALSPAVTEAQRSSGALRPVSTCRPAQLTLSSVMEGAAGGSVREVFRWRNHSTATCTLRGYPQVRLLDARNHPVPIVVHHGAGYLTPPAPVRVVRLNHGDTAYFSLEWGHNLAVGITCVVVHHALLTPPGSSSPQPMGGWAERMTKCGPVVNVSPVEPKVFTY